jgi:hypothetical protein
MVKHNANDFGEASAFFKRDPAIADGEQGFQR